MRAALNDPALIHHQDESALRMVLKRWATMKAVRPRSKISSAFCNRASVTESIALVAFQHHDARIGQHRARKTNQLPLAERQ